MTIAKKIYHSRCLKVISVLITQKSRKLSSHCGILPLNEKVIVLHGRHSSLQLKTTAQRVNASPENGVTLPPSRFTTQTANLSFFT